MSECGGVLNSEVQSIFGQKLICNICLRSIQCYVCVLIFEAQSY
jgi:hypothetical protein